MGSVSLLLVALHVLPTVLFAEWRFKHLFAVSNKAVMAPVIESNINGRSALRTLTEYYQYMEGNMTRVPANPSDYDPLGPHQLPNILKFYGWPTVNDTERLYKPPRKSESRGAERLKQYEKSESAVFEALATLGSALDSQPAARPVKDLLNWTHVFHSDRDNYTTPQKTHKCEVRSNLAYRVNGVWSVRALVTNDRPYVFRAESERQYLSEFLVLRGGRVTVEPLLFNMTTQPKYSRLYWGARAFNAVNRTRVTSLLGKWGGQAGVNVLGQHEIEDNIALREALAASRDLTRQVLDSRTKSEIAILVFPLFMAAVPVALFADISDAGLLGYIVFTDFLSVLPLAIKGGEMLKVGLDHYFATRTIVFGDLESSNTVAAGTWSCFCRADLNNNIVGYGAAFIATAALATVVGVALEFLARAQVERNKRAREMREAVRSLGTESVWERRVPCYDCPCGVGGGNGPSGEMQPAVGGGLIGELQRRRKEQRNMEKASMAFRDSS